MPTNTTTYSFSKPTVGGDSDVWGTELNNNADKLDDVLDGTLPITPAAGNDIDIVGTNAATNTVTTLLTLNSQSTGTPAAGIGSALAFAAETAAGNTEVGAVIEAVTTDVTSTSEDFDLVIKTMAAGATAAERLRVSSAGTTVQTALTVPSVTTAGTLALSATGANVITASTNGSERFRVGPSGELGVAGANFGSAGDVLVSGGSGASPSWQAPSGTPSGAVAYFARNTPPTGWLKANGALVSRTTYASLFAAIGTTFGAGDGSTTFALPDLRGEFIRGWDDGRGVDSGRAFGSAQSDDNKSHTHTGSTSTTGAHTHNVTSGGNTSAIAGRVANGDNSYTAQTATSSAGDHSHTLTINNAGGTEARPRNVALLACIKF